MSQTPTQSHASGRILVSRDGPLARITFNKPERRNAMSLDMWEGLHAALTELACEDATRVVILNGAGGKAFVSGADISEFEAQRSTSEGVTRYNQISEAAEAALYHFPKPTIAEISGFCVGGGMGIAVACDFRICTEDARLGITAGRLGLGYGMSGVENLVALAGPSIAARVLYSAELFTASQALSMGLVSEVAASQNLTSAVNDLAHRIAQNAPLTVKAAKAAIRAIGATKGAPSPQDVETLVAACYASEDYAEGRSAFAEKRKPRFKGR